MGWGEEVEKRGKKRKNETTAKERACCRSGGGSAKKKKIRRGGAPSTSRLNLDLHVHFFRSTPQKQKKLILTRSFQPSQHQKTLHAARPAATAFRRAAVLARAAPKGDPNQKMMWEALREAIDEEMERDPTVCLMGEDVGHYGGSYKVTYDLYKKYGDMRLLDTPICENGFMGVGIGAAMTGLRVVIEGMNMGFLLLAYNQISNNAGMLHYTSGGQFKVPVVIRGPGGVGRQLGAEHSQRLESYFQSIPGVQLVACSTAANAKALLKSAIRSDNPVSWQ